MSRALIVLAFQKDRDKAIEWIRKAPVNTRVQFKKPQRSIDQNSMMWVLLTQVAEQLTWHGVKLTPDDWKLVFLDGLNRELRIVPNMDGTGFVNLGRSSSDLSKEEMGDMITLIQAFGAQHGLKFSEKEIDREAPSGLNDCS